MESSSAALWGHFKQIPQEKLQSHIILRFNSYDVDNSGTLDRAEMREVCVFAFSCHPCMCAAWSSEYYKNLLSTV
jgi:hypothetical protein